MTIIPKILSVDTTANLLGITTARLDSLIRCRKVMVPRSPEGARFRFYVEADLELLRKQISDYERERGQKL